MIFLDTETCGLYGMPVLLQYSIDDGPIELYSIWLKPIRETLELITKIANHEEGIVGFNLSFDWFMLCKLYTIFSLYEDKDAIPFLIVDELADLEMAARDGPCLKPVKACDLMLVARRGPYQSVMDRTDIRIRRIPTALAWQLASELEKRIQLKDIYFARKKDKYASKWNVYDLTDAEGNMDPNFKDVVLKFAPSSALKALAVDALNIPSEDVLRFKDVEVDKSFYPKELGYAPFAKALGGDRTDWKGAWPELIQHHINHWSVNARAREYASDDVKYTRGLYKFFGSPELGDDDSELTCAVAAVRWRGYKIDVAKIKKLKLAALAKIGSIPTAPRAVKHYVLTHLDKTELLVISSKYKAGSGSTKKTILEEIVKLTVDCDCVAQKLAADDTVCEKCKGTGSVAHPGAARAKEVLGARAAVKEIELYDKLLIAGRFHASFKVIGTLSSRMSGADGLNPQGIRSTKEVRAAFPLAHGGHVLCGGDYSGFEITLAEACYNDPELRKDLLTCEDCNGEMQRINEKVAASAFLSPHAFEKYLEQRQNAEVKKQKKLGEIYKLKSLEEIRQESFENDFICIQCGSNSGKKIHALFGVHVFPDMTYEQIKATTGTADDKYTKCKQAVFAMLYGGEGPTLQDRLGVELEIANLAFEKFTRKYRRVGVERNKVYNMFQSMRQVGGIGSKVEWHEPADKIESMFGHPRYFTLENKICFALFSLANQPPKSWKDIRIRVQRRDREQTASGAVQSALYAAAFNLQSSNTRAALNHVIQSSGAQITKKTQRIIWDIQPSGVNAWLVQPCNIHDEIECPCDPSVVEEVRNRVLNCVESFRPKVPLIKIEWSTHLKTWADKG